MKIIFRRALRAILKYLCIIAISKHQLEIVGVGGWHGTDITREAVYAILKSNGKKVRRIIHTPQVDWDIPLTILGVRAVPTNIFSWIYTICISIVRLIVLKPNPSLLVLQIDAHDAGIMKYWMSFITFKAVVMINSHAGTLNLELLLVDRLKSDGLLVLNNDNVRTKSLAQGRSEHVVYFGKKVEGDNPAYFYDINKKGKDEFLDLYHEAHKYAVKKAFPEFVYPFLTASVAISGYFAIPFEEACASLNNFELPSDKIHQIFHKFIDE